MRTAFLAPRCAAAALLLALATGALAQAQAPQVAASATSQRNVYAAGADVRPARAIAGDFMAVGGRVVIDQPIAGDATVAGGSVDVHAPVGDDLRAAGGSVTLSDRVGGDLVAVGGDLTLRSGSRVAGSAQLRGAAVALHGRIDGDLDASGQTVLIDGEVGGAASVTADRIEFGPNAKLSGPVSYASPAEMRRSPGARMHGPLTRDMPAAMGTRWGGHGGGLVVPLLALLACATLFLLLFPTTAETAADRLRATPLQSLATGLLVVLLLPVLAVLFFVTVFGIPLGMLLLAAYPVLLLAGLVVGTLALARVLPPALGRPLPAVESQRIGWFALAAVLVVLLGLVPFAGPLFIALLSLAGLGAGVVQSWKRRRARATVPPAGPARVQEGTTPA